MHPNQSSLGPACLASCKASATLEFRIEGAREICSSDTRCSRDNHSQDTDGLHGGTLSRMESHLESAMLATQQIHEKHSTCDPQDEGHHHPECEAWWC